MSACQPSDTTSTHVVRIVLSLPMSVEAFTDSKQAAFRRALAQVASVSDEDVLIVNIESMNIKRRLLAEAIHVETNIKASSASAAASIAGKLTEEAINEQLSNA